MALTKHHDLINTDYFGNTLYIRELQKNIGRDLTKLEKEIIENTLRTFLKINNLWSNYSNKADESFYKIKAELENYLSKYERKINNKFVDLFCLELYNDFEIWLDEMIEIDNRELDKKCNSIKSQITKILDDLESINFDYNYNGYFYYKRNPSNKTKKGYASILEYNNNLEKYIEEYNNLYGYDRINDDDVDIRNYIMKLYDTFGMLIVYFNIENYKGGLQLIVQFLAEKRPNFISEHIYYMQYILNDIADFIICEKYDLAYEKTLNFIKVNQKWYVRSS